MRDPYEDMDEATLTEYLSRLEDHDAEARQGIFDWIVRAFFALSLVIVASIVFVSL